MYAKSGLEASGMEELRGIALKTKGRSSFLSGFARVEDFNPKN